jgi:hypothetical protein
VSHEGKAGDETDAGLEDDRVGGRGEQVTLVGVEVERHVDEREDEGSADRSYIRAAAGGLERCEQADEVDELLADPARQCQAGADDETDAAERQAREGDEEEQRQERTRVPGQACRKGLPALLADGGPEPPARPEGEQQQAHLAPPCEAPGGQTCRRHEREDRAYGGIRHRVRGRTC